MSDTDVEDVCWGLSEMAAVVDEVLGKRIHRIYANDVQLLFCFEDGVSLLLRDAGQSCCEVRYLHTDDDPGDLRGQRLASVELTRVAPGTGESSADFHELHEVAFLRIQGDRSGITVEAHNEHNGYYAGFAIEATLGTWT